MQSIVLDIGNVRGVTPGTSGFLFLLQNLILTIPTDFKFPLEHSNKYSSNHTHRIIRYLFAFILFLISWNLPSYSKFEVLIKFILNNTYDVVDLDSSQLNIYKNYKISMVRLRTLEYSIKGCGFLLFL